MKKPVLAICDEEGTYASKLYEFIHEREKETYEVVLFTGAGECELFMKERKISILVISEVLRAILTGGINAENVLILTDNRPGPQAPGNSIYRFQSGEMVLKDILKYCAEGSAPVIRRNTDKPLSVIGVYSPIKRTFQTTFAITLGQILSKRGKALYLNFECFSGFDSTMSSKNKSDLMDLMYFWSCGSDNFSVRLGSVIETIGTLDYVPPVHSFRNFEGISSEKWLEFIRAFEEYTDYEYLILDLSENVNGLLDILRICSEIFTLTDDRRISTAKLNQYETLLRETMYEDLLDKTRQMQIPIFREIPEDFEMLPYSEIAEYIKRELRFMGRRKKEAGFM